MNWGFTLFSHNQKEISNLKHKFPIYSINKHIISPVKQATHELPNIVKKIEDEIVNKELVPLMEDFFREELIYFTSDEFSDRICDKKGNVKTVSWEELNGIYNTDDFMPVDGRLVRICDHLSALQEAAVSIEHGITSKHLTTGRDGMLSHYKKDELISGINVYELFHSIV